ncbi:MAG: PBP1A family penicillin-binding protein [Eubacteriales bacterium]|nr:PBP1A family penicillin-binding protein [Eubacteriales bacterium]
MKKKKRNRRKKSEFFFQLTQLCVLCVLAGFVALFFLAGYPQKVYSLYREAQAVAKSSAAGDFQSGQSGEVYGADGERIALLQNDKNIVYLTFEEIPETVRQAFVSIEDKRFYRHHGVDPLAVLRAAASFVSKNAVTQGGSTITQQLARNIYLTHTVRWERKVEEIFIAMALETKYSKDEILEFYINNIYFANGCYGIEAASRKYFSVPASQLTLSQTAFLCAVPNNPTVYDPLLHPDNTVKRRDLILKNMYEDDCITGEEYREALAEEISLSPAESPSFTRTWAHTYIYDCATRALMDATGESYEVCRGMLYNDGCRVYTSIDMEAQALLQDAVDRTLENYNTKSAEGAYALQASAVTVDNATGLVTAIVGGRSQQDISTDYNRAYLSFRQPGSAVKPLIVYTPALERGYTASSTVMDTKEEDGPANAGGYAGAISLRTAVEQSKNTVAYKLFRELTPEVGLSYLLDMNFSSIEESDYTLSASLGGFSTGVSALEMTSAYAALAYEGVYRLPTCVTLITDRNGKVLAAPEAAEKQVYQADAARQMTDILEGVMTRGTARGHALEGMPCAGKTGTTNDNLDGWFIGYTGYYTTGVWVGFDSPRSDSTLSGSTYPLDIWYSYMTALHEGLPAMELKD